MSDKLVIIGMGGHSKVVTDVAKKNGYEILGYLDDSEPTYVCSNYLGRIDSYRFLMENDVKFFVAIGDNSIRKKISERLSLKLSSYATLIDNTAVIGTGVSISPGTLLMPGAIVNADAKIGSHCIINTAATVDHDCVIGDFAHLSPGSHLAGAVWIGECVQIGTGASVIPKVRIGDCSTIGAGATVIRNIPENSVAVGVPARVIEKQNKIEGDVDMIPLSGPSITQREKDLVMEVLDSGHLGLGPKMKQFEEMMAAYAGTKYAIACNSGTSGLHMLIRAMGIEDGDEVITTPFSFVASANCMLFERAVPVFVDIDEQTYNLDVAQIEAKITERTKAILPVHVFGQPANMDEIRRLAYKYDLRVIEDSCEAIGAKWNGENAGALGDAGVFAFYPNKQITTGEGGIIVTDDEELAKLCYSLRNQGRGEEGHWLSHVRLGYNYRMDDMSAALGIAQMERIDEILGRRAEIAQLYIEKFQDVPGVILPTIDPRAEMSWFVFVVRFEEHIDRDQVMQRLLDRGIGCRPYFTPIHLQPFYMDMFGFGPGDFPVTEKVAAGTLAIPFFNGLTTEQIDHVVQAIKEEIATFQLTIA